jgi:hypothetical protein
MIAFQSGPDASLLHTFNPKVSIHRACLLPLYLLFVGDRDVCAPQSLDDPSCQTMIEM